MTMSKKTKKNQKNSSSPTKNNETTRDFDPFFIECRTLPDTFNEEDRTVEVEYVTESKVLRYDYYLDSNYWEVLSTDVGDVRLDLLNDSGPVIDSHNRYSVNNIFGVVVSANETTATIRFAKDDISQVIFEKIRDGIITKVSVGYTTYELTKSGEEDGIPIYRATDWEPFEISLVAVPADRDAKIRSSEHAGKRTQCKIITPDTATRGEISNQERAINMTKEERLAAEKAAAELARTKGDIVPSAPPAEVIVAGVSPEEAQRMQDAAVALETDRCQEIRTISEKHGLGREFQDLMINEKRSINEVNAAVLEKLGEDIESVQTRSVNRVGVDHSQNHRSEGIANAILYRADPNSFELSEHGRDFAGLSLMDMARDFIPERSIRRPMEIAERAMTTTDMPLVLMDAMNKMVTVQFAEAKERTHTQWARRRTANDFKDLHSIQVDGDFKLEKVDENGEYKSTYLVEGSNKYRIGKFGKKIHFSIEMLINDDMSVFEDVLPGFTAGSIETELETVYGILQNNPTLSDGDALFHANHNNLLTDVYSIAGMEAMSLKMKKQKSLSDKKLSVPMDFIIYGDEIDPVVDRILTSDHIPTTINDVNPYGPKGRKTITAIYEPLISEIDETTWFAGTNANKAKHVSYAHLNGYETPLITRVPGQDPDGLTVLGRHFFGAGAEDFRGIYKSTGAG